MPVAAANAAPVYLSVAQVAHLTSCSKKFIAKLADSGELESIRPNGHKRLIVAKSAIAKFPHISERIGYAEGGAA